MLYCLILLLCLSSTYLTLSLNDDATILRQAKLDLSDPAQSLSSWSNNDVTPCQWNGISCDATSAIVSVDLSSFSLVGPFPSIICHLPSLSFLSLYNNSINGSLSDDDFTACRNLNHLNLSQNLLVGSIPKSLPFKLPNLQNLEISGNNLSDTIPASFGEFHKLESLNLAGNLLSGTIPASLGNISTLKELKLAYNLFSPSQIPSQLGNLTELRILWLAGCNLIGPVPPALSGLTRLVNLDLAYNHLTGTVPSWITQLKSIEQIEIFNNSFSGELPEAMDNMTMLRRFDASTNKLRGKIPDGLTRLNQLESLNLFENMLEGPLPESITNSKTLYELKLFNNRLTGAIPNQLGANSPLQDVDLSYNRLSGEIPTNICGEGKLEYLILIDNSFTGEISNNLGKCRSLTRVRLSNNNLSGHIPDDFWGLPRLSLLELSENSFTGQIPKTIAGAKNLSNLRISKNQFSGSIPNEIGSLNGLIEISGAQNNFTGEIPSNLVKLKQLSRLDLSTNQLSGEIPKGIRGWKNLNELNLANNHLSGKIPREVGNLPVLNYLDLSKNQFSGDIPLELQNLKLNVLNLSYNLLTGKIPPLYAKKVYSHNFIGNPGLCVDVDGLCQKITRSKNIGYVWILLSIFTLAGLVFVVGIVMFIAKCRKLRALKNSRLAASKWRSFHKLHFSEHEIADCLKEQNVIGSGSSGKVYKAELSGGQVVAVKKLNNKTAKGGNEFSDSLNRDVFAAEVETLGTIRHKNIVRLWCCCNSGDCKLLVYEYMPNGSLADVLHPGRKGEVLLGWPERLRIALDAAEGLSYLHHDCVPPIVHRDVKSSNILLDGDFSAKVADFGIAKMGQMSGAKTPEAMSGIAGSCGYIAPEYVYTLRVNEKSDIYSFGVVLLELVTGKQPTDPELGDIDMAKWVCTTLDHCGLEPVIDPKLDLRFKEEISKVIHIGLLCTSPLPLNRPSMRKVVIMLQEVSGTVSCSSPTASKRCKSGKLSPYYTEDLDSV